MEQVRYADNIPPGLWSCSIPEKFIKNFKEEIIVISSKPCKNTATVSVNHSQTIYARLAKEKIAHYLEVEGTCYSWFDSGFLPRRQDSF